MDMIPASLRALGLIVFSAVLLISAPVLAQAEHALNETQDTNIQTNKASPSGNESQAEVHVYVYNKDDDRLKISLFLDSELKETADVSSDSEKKFGSYELAEGNHSFKIVWRDEDTKKSYEEEMTKWILDGESLLLYATENDSPEKFDLSVQVKNENECDLDVYLYVDGDYEKSKEAKKNSCTDLGKISLEEGSHKLSLRWRDCQTEMEYEKKKQIDLDGDEALIFYAPKGVTFGSKEGKELSAKISSETIESSSTSPKVNAGEAKSNGTSKNSEATSMPFVQTLQSERLKTSLSSAKEPTPAKADNIPFSNAESEREIYAYAVVVLLALYLFFRH